VRMLRGGKATDDAVGVATIGRPAARHQRPRRFEKPLGPVRCELSTPPRAGSNGLFRRTGTIFFFSRGESFRGLAKRSALSGSYRDKRKDSGKHRRRIATREKSS